MIIIGLTGGISSGKSTVSAILKELGAYIIDADAIAREVVMPGRPAWREIIHVFGAKILQEDGQINRKALADIVFQDEEARRKLNEITHPRISEERNRIIAEIAAKDEKAIIVFDVPLLIETGMYKEVDEVWLVALPEDLQIKRLINRDKISEEEALRRISSQMPLAEKKKYAHHIIDTSGSRIDTIKQVYKLWKQLVLK
ncbi:MAG: dephospho-CoA kinase [Bacillota bacterium]|jgi:dephospho-CoA kinase